MAESLNALSLVIGMQTEAVTAGVSSIRQQLGRANRIMQMAKTDTDRLGEGIVALNVAYQKGSKTQDDLIKGLGELHSRYGDANRATSEAAASEQRLNRLIAQSRSETSKLVADMRLLITAKRDGRVETEEFAAVQSMLKSKMAELRKEEQRQRAELNGTAAAAKEAERRLARVKQTIQGSIPQTTRLALEIRDLRREYAAGNIGANEFARTNKHLRNRLEELRRGVDRSSPSMENARRKFEAWRREQDKAANQTIPKLISGLKGLVAGYIALETAKKVGRGVSGIAMAGQEMEANQTAFEVFTGSAERGSQLLDELIGLASSTPLEFETLNKASRTMLAFGVEVDNILPSLKQLGDISAGDAERMDRLSLVFAQVATNGRLMGQDLLQFVNAGFNPLAEMARTTGKSMEQLRKEMEKGEITFNMVQQAMASITSEGGRAAGMMDKFAETTAGKVSMLNSEWQLFKVALDKKTGFSETKGHMAEDLASLLKWFRGASDEAEELAKKTEEVGKAVKKAASVASTRRETEAQMMRNLDTETESILSNYRNQNVELKLGAEYLEQLLAVERGASDEQLADLKRLQERNKLLKEQQKLADDFMKEEKKRLDDLVKAGERVRDSLRSPFNVAKDEIKELLALLQSGMLNQAEFEAAARKAGQGQFQQPDSPPAIAAIEAGSQEAYKRMTGNIQDEREKQLAVLEEQAFTQQALLAAMQESNRIARARPNFTRAR